MTDKFNYEKMLDSAYEQLPKRTATDERFELPILDTFPQGSKTIVKNFDTALEKIRRKKEEVIKYLSRELAIPISHDGSRLTLNGKINSRLLNEKFSDYVNSHVLCKECKKPDTNIIEEHGVKVLRCEACGAKSPVR
ncbi:translation initiation factor IF-2 subunit beta [Candidatus Micrarchaeota archaeon CG11_big_fil_rev_8_21_14_0_20_47_5]|nr:MAG: translation initiation factor IF-2 subunit beta [Candidatus Micrarchaeota archaeon CG1_02_47_40]PIN83863.1 MAG: translation initiation factor IF-2 subunit beta [Candidatus Micrarchaeota archaeon CG11_big_fil_rev_8_21_14_0_20_47_5]